MRLSEADVEFLTNHRSASMITVTPEGVAKTSRVGIALVDGRLWSSGTQDRVRTKRLRRDPLCTLFAWDDAFAWLALETTVRILDGDDAAELSVRLFRVMQGKATGPISWFGGDLSEDDFLQKMADDGRLIYEFEVLKSYGLR
jgi:hypothetical protein